MKSFKCKPRVKTPTLKFSPTAWAKLLYLRDRGDTEVGGFGICHGDDLLKIDDVQLVQQVCTSVTVEFDDESVADFFDKQVDAGLKPEQFGRIWIHTHPGASARPSGTDEATFARVFGSSQWALMFIVAEEGETYARLQCNVGPRVSQELAVEIDYAQEFDGTDWEAWEEEYVANVQIYEWPRAKWTDEAFDAPAEVIPQAWRDAWHDYSDDEFQEMMAYE
jgi:proteasome lid subunit RPN8/RPN11